MIIIKKIIFIILILLIIYSYNNINTTIPNDSIRFRIISNSNSISDINTKLQIRKDLTNNFFPLLEKSKSIEESRKIIKENQNLIEQTLSKYNVQYNINYGNNYFPSKTYKGKKYNSGEYESLVISLGEAKGDNWWCIMYPPLCLIDSNSNNTEEAEYKLYIEELISRLTS